MVDITSHLGMQVKITMNYLYPSIRLAKMKTSGNTKCRGKCGEVGSLRNCWWGCTTVPAPWRTVWQCLKQIQHATTTQPSSGIHGHLSQRNENYVHTEACAQMLIVILLVIAPKGKQPKYLSRR